MFEGGRLVDERKMFQGKRDRPKIEVSKRGEHWKSGVVPKEDIVRREVGEGRGIRIDDGESSGRRLVWRSCCSLAAGALD